MEDDLLAEETLHALVDRFTGHPSLDGIFEDLRLRALRNDEAYIASMRRMLAEQDSLYDAVYDAYRHGRFAEVKSTITNHKSQILSDKWSLAPRFLFLNAVSVARTEGQEAFIAELQELVDRYPTTELGSMAKDMLAMMGQGMESQTGGSTGSLADRRGQVEEETKEAEEQEQQWSEDRKQPSIVLLRLPKPDEEALNELLYQVALFNFSQFLIRDFDLQKMPVLGDGCALRVSGFADMDEAEWWVDMIRKSTDMQPVLIGVEIQALAEVNLPLVR